MVSNGSSRIILICVGFYILSKSLAVGGPMRIQRVGKLDDVVAEGKPARLKIACVQ
jgi:hypothetical protein